MKRPRNNVGAQSLDVVNWAPGGTTHNVARSYSMNCLGLNFQIAKLFANVASRSRGAIRPSSAFISRPHRGRGECRVPAAPAASCALCGGRTHTRNNEYTGTTGIPARNGFNGFLRALPGDRACLPPSFAKIAFRKLDASVGASGPHDFAVRKLAHSSARRLRPPHPAPNVRDDRETPL